MTQAVLVHGVHDRFSELIAFGLADLEARLLPQTYLRHECVAFAGGAVLVGGAWVVAHGNDRNCDLYAFDHAALERLLVPVESEALP